MKTILKLFISSALFLLFSQSSFAYEQGDAARKYDAQNGRKAQPVKRKTGFGTKRSTSYKKKSYSPSFKSNYSKYKGYSPKKKKRYKSKWGSFKSGSKWNSLSDSDKSKLRRRVLEKNKKRKKRNAFR